MRGLRGARWTQRWETPVQPAFWESKDGGWRRKAPGKVQGPTNVPEKRLVGFSRGPGRGSPPGRWKGLCCPRRAVSGDRKLPVGRSGQVTESQSFWALSETPHLELFIV